MGGLYSPVQFVVFAHDHPDALDRRLAVRERHLDGVRRMKAEGTFFLGGALLDDAGGMIGSMMLVEFPDRAALDAWLADEVYLNAKVWETVDVRPFRMAPV